MPKYTVTSPLMLAGRIRPEGETVELPEADGKRLIELGAVAPVAKKVKAEEPKPEAAE
jgi:hypothetical protein